MNALVRKLAANARDGDQAMADLVVLPGHLEVLANKLNEAGLQAEQAAVVTTHIKTEVWKTYGPVFGIINDGFAEIERARRAAVRSWSCRCIDHAASVRAAIHAYVSDDALSGESLDEQIRDSELSS